MQTNPESVVLIDEAYVDFGAESAVELTKKYANLLVTMTFSKSRSLAGARLGFCIGNEELIKDLSLIKYSTNPYNVNSLTQLLGIAALEDNAVYMANCQKIIETREYVISELKSLGFEVTDSKTNFIFAKTNAMSGEKIYQELKKRGILVRHLSGERIKDYNRITIGTAEEMAVFLAKIREIIEVK